MSALHIDTKRAMDAVKLILDGRDPVTEIGAVMVTLETVVTTVLLLAMNRDHKRALGMLNEGLVPGVEGRIGDLAARRGKR